MNGQRQCIIAVVETTGSNHTFAAAAGTPYAAEAAAETYRAGGNAADAAVAAAAAVSVTEPLMSSIGGGGFALVRDPSGESRAHRLLRRDARQGAARFGFRGRRQPADHDPQVRGRGALHRRGGVVGRPRLLQGMGEASRAPRPAGARGRRSRPRSGSRARGSGCARPRASGFRSPRRC